MFLIHYIATQHLSKFHSVQTETVRFTTIDKEDNWGWCTPSCGINQGMQKKNIFLPSQDHAFFGTTRTRGGWVGVDSTPPPFNSSENW